MKKMIGVFLFVLFLAGCGTLVKQSGFWEHDSHYHDWEHLKFSWYGYKHPSKEILNPEVANQPKPKGGYGYTLPSQETDVQKWWGIPIDVDPKN